MFVGTGDFGQRVGDTQDTSEEVSSLVYFQSLLSFISLIRREKKTSGWGIGKTKLLLSPLKQPNIVVVTFWRLCPFGRAVAASDRISVLIVFVFG
jgi:hypothetical protein